MFRILLSLFLGVAGSATAADKPNFILIFVDDLGYADIGPFGSSCTGRRIWTGWRSKAAS